MKTILIVLAVAIFGIGGYTYLSNQSSSPYTPNATSNAVSSKQPTTQSSSVAEENVQIINMEAGSFYYKPNIIKAKVGSKIKIVMNSVSMMHDFVIDELNVKMQVVKNGETGTVEFTPDKVGSFEYYCSVGQHRANGQVGTLIVE